MTKEEKFVDDLLNRGQAKLNQRENKEKAWNKLSRQEKGKKLAEWRKKKLSLEDSVRKTN